MSSAGGRGAPRRYAGAHLLRARRAKPIVTRSIINTRRVTIARTRDFRGRYGVNARRAPGARGLRLASPEPAPHFIQQRGVDVVDRRRHLLGVILVVFGLGALQQAERFFSSAPLRNAAGMTSWGTSLSMWRFLDLFPVQGCAYDGIGEPFLPPRQSSDRRELHQLDAVLATARGYGTFYLETGADVARAS